MTESELYAQYVISEECTAIYSTGCMGECGGGGAPSLKLVSRRQTYCMCTRQVERMALRSEGMMEAFL